MKNKDITLYLNNTSTCRYDKIRGIDLTCEESRLQVIVNKVVSHKLCTNIILNSIINTHDYRLFNYRTKTIRNTEPFVLKNTFEFNSKSHTTSPLTIK